MKSFFSNSLPGFRLALIGIVLAAGVVGLGAFTRLVHAGLGCPDWPGCYGHLLWPNEAHEIVAANEAFPDMPVIDGKAWPEMVHRYFAGTLGLLILAMAVIAIRNRHHENYPFRLPLFMLFLVIWQALFGMWTVTLKLWPQVVTIHLLGGFATFVLIVVMAQRLSSYQWRLPEVQLEKVLKLKPWLILGIVIVAMQILLGGWVASNYAALACPTKEFPTCFGTYWPEMDFAHGFNFAQDIGPNYLGGLLHNEARVAIHYMHRVGALVTTVYLIVLAALCYAPKIKPLSTLTSVMLAVLAVQVILGISNVMMGLPLSIAVAHNVVGAILLAVICSLATQCLRAQRLETREEQGE
ncbi:MAG: COX15/CtaA family protein [Pseudomonadales bacterium]